jgi:hypothetical protein
MPKLQEVFDRINQNKKEQRKIRESYKDSLSNNGDYQVILEKADELKQKKKEIEEETKREMGSSYDKLDIIKTDIQMDSEMLADIAISHLVNGKKVEVQDEYDNKYEPAFKVNFKKAN